MSYLQLKQTYTHKKQWICSCGRKNDKEDERCAFCRQAKPEKVKGQPRVRSSRCMYDGRWYQSKKEMEYAKELDFRKKAGDVMDWTPQYKVRLEVNGVFICSYYVDFRVILPDGSVQLVEVKGFEAQLWRIKKKLILALLKEIDPDAEYIVVK